MTDNKFSQYIFRNFKLLCLNVGHPKQRSEHLSVNDRRPGKLPCQRSWSYSYTHCSGTGQGRTSGADEAQTLRTAFPVLPPARIQEATHRYASVQTR